MSQRTPAGGGIFWRGLCLVIAGYFLLSPIYALLHFEDYAASFPHVVRYILGPGAIAAAFIGAAIFAPAGARRMAGLYGASVLAALFLFEGLLTARSVAVRLDMLGQLNERERAAVEGGDSTLRGFTPGALNRLAEVETLPEAILSGFPGARVILCAHGGQPITYVADHLGFNNAPSVTDAAIDVAVLGDSFVEGFCLPPGEDVVARLRAEGVRASSLGLRGNGPLTELATLGRFGPVLRPPHVLMAFFEGNDWENLENEVKQPWLRAALAPDADYGSLDTARGSMERARARIGELNRDRITTEDLLTETAILRNFAALQQTSTALGLFQPKAVQDIPEFPLILRRARALTESWGGRFTLVYIPRVDRFLGVMASDTPFDPLRELVLRAAAAEGVEVIDLREALERHPDPVSVYAADGHFSREGAIFAADVIAATLPSQKAAVVDASARVDGATR